MVLILVFLLVNYVIFLIIDLPVGSGWLSFSAILLGYYFMIRRIITYVIFPGCFPIFLRRLEVTMQEQMGKMILDQLREFSLCLDMYRSGQSDPGMDDFSRTQFLSASAKQVRFVITNFSRQVQCQRVYHRRILEAMNQKVTKRDPKQ